VGAVGLETRARATFNRSEFYKCADLWKGKDRIELGLGPRGATSRPGIGKWTEETSVNP
jgi:hypothetical protein